ncbi:MAG: hypothetical protein R6U98_06885, partial [Pirellulaceae bacterium]
FETLPVAAMAEKAIETGLCQLILKGSFQFELLQDVKRRCEHARLSVSCPSTTTGTFLIT